jgi:hypothetical protein
MCGKRQLIEANLLGRLATMPAQIATEFAVRNETVKNVTHLRSRTQPVAYATCAGVI